MTLRETDDARLRVALLTGASGGIGKAIAMRLAQHDFRLILTSLCGDELEVVRRELRHPELHTTLAADLTDPESIEKNIGPAARGEEIDLLINCAGAGHYCRFFETDASQFNRLMQLNYFAPVQLTRMVLGGMLARRRGHVINISSTSAVVGPWGHSAYAPAKAALTRLTEILAGEYAGSGVHFSVVHPGIIRTMYFCTPETRRLWQRVSRHAIPPQPVAAAIERLVRRPRLYLSVPRHYRLLSIMAALAPQLAHRLVTASSRPLVDGELTAPPQRSHAIGKRGARKTIAPQPLPQVS